VHWLRRLVSGFSLQRLEFVPRSLQVEFVMSIVAQTLVYSEFFPCQYYYTVALHTHTLFRVSLKADSITGFLWLWYAYHQWYASHCSVVHWVSYKKSKDIKIKPWHSHTQTNTYHMHTRKRWVHTVRILSCLTKRVTIIFLIVSVQKTVEVLLATPCDVHKILIGGTLNVLNGI
jgi:hypothetical protein